MKNLLLVVLIGLGLTACNPRPPVLKSPCVAAASINADAGDNPCVRRPVNLNLFKL